MTLNLPFLFQDSLQELPEVSQEVDSTFIPTVSPEQRENDDLIPSYPKTSLSPPGLSNGMPYTSPSPSRKSEEAVLRIDRDTMLNSYLKKPISNLTPQSTRVSSSPNLDSVRNPSPKRLTDMVNPTQPITIIPDEVDGFIQATTTDSTTTADENPNPTQSPEPIVLSLRTDQPQAVDDRTAQNEKPWMKVINNNNKKQQQMSSNNVVELVVGDDENNDDQAGKKYKTISRWPISSDVARVVARKRIVVS